MIPLVIGCVFGVVCSTSSAQVKVGLDPFYVFQSHSKAEDPGIPSLDVILWVLSFCYYFV